MPLILGLLALAGLVGLASRGGGRRRRSTSPPTPSPTPNAAAAAEAAERLAAQEATAEDFEALAAHATDMGEHDSAAAFEEAATAAPEAITVEDVSDPLPASHTPIPVPVPVPVPVLPALLEEEEEEEEEEGPADMSFTLEEAEAEAPPSGFNPAVAARLAPAVQADLQRHHGRYSRTQMRNFQTAAGIDVDGFYGGQSRGALVFFDIPDAHRTLSNPRTTAPYMWEYYIRSMAA